MLVSGRKLAEELGVSESLVRKAVKAGRIERGADGKFDLDVAVAAWEKGRVEPKPSPGRAKSNHRIVHNRDDDDDEGAEEDDEDGEPGSGSLYYQLNHARVVKETAMGNLRALEYEQKREALVEKEFARKVFFEHRRVVRDAILNMPSRIGAIQAAALLAYVNSVLNEHLTDARVAKLASCLDPKKIESIVTDTMAAECRAILEGIAEIPPPAFEEVQPQLF